MGEPVVDNAGDNFERCLEERDGSRVGECLGTRLGDEHEHGTVILVGRAAQRRQRLERSVRAVMAAGGQ